MCVEIFDREQFENALKFLPFPATEVYPNGQLIWHTPVVGRVKCACGEKFFADIPNSEHQKCTSCGKVGIVDTLVLGEVYIAIYSSIDPVSGYSRGTGKDSIRVVLMRHDGEPLGKSGKYVTRVAGWEKRLKNTIRSLWSLALRLPRCRECGKIAGTYTCRRGNNAGKKFYKCWDHSDRWIGWVKE